MSQDKRRPEGSNLFMDVFAWFSNVVTSILIIFLTKWLLTTYQFKFATTVCGMHFLSCAAAIQGASSLKFIEQAPVVPMRDVLMFSVIGSISIATANLSLMLNTVGFYQIAKLLLAPFVCFVESTWFGKRFSVPVLFAILVTLVGVGIVTVNDVGSNLMGTIMAVIFVISSGFQQILCGHLQAKHGLQSHQLLANTSPVQGVMLLMTGPGIDYMITGRWIFDWRSTRTGIEVLVLSCLVAVAVNLSQFLCLGRFSATSFQVLGHAKTILVLLGGWALFHDHMNLRGLSGMLLAISGMIGYGYFMSKGGVRTVPQKDTHPKA